MSTRRLLGVLAIALWLAGCAPAPERPGMPASELERAQQLADQGQYSDAAALYLAAAAEAPADRRHGLLLQAADWYLQDEQFGQARGVIDRIRRAGLAPGDRLRFDLVAAAVALELAAPAQALALMPLDAAEVPPDRRLEYHRLRAEALLADDKPFESARERMRLTEWLAAPEDVRDNRERLISALLRMSPEAMQRRMEDLPPADRMRGWLALAYQMKTRLFEGEPMEQALREWRQRFPEHPAGDVLADAVVDRYQASFTYPEQMALLLPLSGRFSEAAEAIRNGFFAAWYEDTGRKPALRVYDVAQHPQGVVGAYRQAVNDGAGWVVGPLEREHVEELRSQPDLSVPVLALNYADGVGLETAVAPGTNAATAPTMSGQRARFYQFGLLPEQEARQAAQRLMADGRDRALVLAPLDDWGQRMMQAFVAEYVSLGGYLTEVGRFDSNETDHSDVLRRLLALDESQRRARALEQLLGRKIEFVPQARDDADALFLAGRADQARLIRPQLRFFEAGGLPVYGTSHIYTGRPAPGSDADLDGVAFCDAPWMLGVSERGPSRQVLARLFPSAAGSMGRLLAVGADAYRLIPYLDWLTDHPGDEYPGLSGALSVGAGLRLQRELAWAEFRNGRPEPAPARFGRGG